MVADVIFGDLPRFRLSEGCEGFPPIRGVDAFLAFTFQKSSIEVLL